MASGFTMPKTNWGGPPRPDAPLRPSDRGETVTRETVPQFVEPSQRPRQQPVDKETKMLARIATEAPRIPWDKFITQTLDWQTGEHFGLIGPTGQGKTTMLLNLLPLHPYVVVTATKPRDKTMQALITSGYQKMERWQSMDADQYPRRVLWPDASRLGAEENQRRVFLDAMDKIYREGHWTFAIDELWYFVNELKLERQVKVYLQQARSLDISLLVGTQRPAFIPLEVYDQSTHLMFWRDNDERNLNRISGISYLSADLIKMVVSRLERYQVLYINTRTGEMVRTRCPNVQLPTVKGGKP